MSCNGSFIAAGADDWAVLCSVKGEVSLLVFSLMHRSTRRSWQQQKRSQRLQQQREGKDVLGFNWGIDRATPLQVHEAQTGLEHRPPAPDHDALADSVIEHRTIYHFYAKGHWTMLDMPE